MPSTEAGKRVVSDLTIGYVAVPKGSWNECEALATILVERIEAEAVAAERARIRAAVEALDTWDVEDWLDDDPPGVRHVDIKAVDRAAVLRIVEDIND